MKYKTFEQWCKDESIEVVHKKEIYSSAIPHHVALSIMEETGISTCTSTTYGGGRKVISLGTTDSVAARWHELGHLMHIYGGHKGTVLKTTKLDWELAANSWAFKHHKYTEDTIKELNHCIMTYIDGGYNEAHALPEFQSVAKTLGIYELIQWKTT